MSTTEELLRRQFEAKYGYADWHTLNDGYQNPIAQARWETWKDAYSHGYKDALKAAAYSCDGQFDLCTARPNCHSLDSQLIKSLPIPEAQK